MSADFGQFEWGIARPKEDATPYVGSGGSLATGKAGRPSHVGEAAEIEPGHEVAYNSAHEVAEEEMLVGVVDSSMDDGPEGIRQRVSSSTVTRPSEVEVKVNQILKQAMQNGLFNHCLGYALRPEDMPSMHEEARDIIMAIVKTASVEGREEMKGLSDSLRPCSVDLRGQSDGLRDRSVGLGGRYYWLIRKAEELINEVIRVVVATKRPQSESRT